LSLILKIEKMKIISIKISNLPTLSNEMNKLFDEIVKSYAKNEYNIPPTEDVQKHKDHHLINMFAFCNVLYESQVELTREQIGTMLSVLTPEQTEQISAEFNKNNAFWY
jgi:hypothetical protein